MDCSDEGSLPELAALSRLFSDAPGGTLVRDRVEYEVPFGPLGEIARRLFVARQIRRIFAFRRAAIEDTFL